MVEVAVSVALSPLAEGIPSSWFSSNVREKHPEAT